MAMKKYYLVLAALLILFNWNSNSQTVEGFETCTGEGDPFEMPLPWGCGGECYVFCSADNPHSGNYCGLIPGDETTNTFFNLGNQIFGQWGLEFWMYIPSDKEAYWNLNSGFLGDELIVGNVFFNQDTANPGIGLIDDTALGAINFNFPHDEWFKVVMNWDISVGLSLATWQFNVDGVDVIPAGTSFTNNSGITATGLGGIFFSSISENNELFLDDFLFINGFIDITPNPGPFTDDMESYIEGEPINGAHWTDAGCGGGEGCSIMSTSAFAHEGSLSGLVPEDETTRAVLILDNIIFGEWFFNFWAYVPSNKEASFIIHQEVPINNETPFSRFSFNKDLNSPGVGKIENTYLGDVTFNFPHDQWFRIVINWDIATGLSLATWQVLIADDIVFDGAPYLDEMSDPATALGGIEFNSTSANNKMYVDDFIFQNSPILNLNDYNYSDFKIYPNPSNNFIHVQLNEEIKSLTIYNVLGKSILTASKTNKIDISSLSKGLYFVNIETENGRGTQKLIKN